MRILLLQPMDVPEAFDELAAELGAETVSWPPAASAMPEDQAITGLPVARERVAEVRPELIVAAEQASNLGAQLAAESGVRLLLIDVRPVPPVMVDEVQAIETVENLWAEVGMERLFEEMGAATERGASQAELGELYLDFMERELMPAETDPFRRREGESRLRIMRRDGIVPQVTESQLPPWHEALRDPELNARSAIVFTAEVPVVADWVEWLRQHGFPDTRSVPMPHPWYWAAPEQAKALIEEFAAS